MHIRKKLLLVLILILVAVVPASLQAQRSFVNVTSPNPVFQFVVSDQPRDVVGTVSIPGNIDFSFWKFEIRSNAPQGYVQLGDQRVPGADWVTVGNARTERNFSGVLGTVPPVGTLSVNSWRYRIAIVRADGSFVEEPFVGRFEMRLPISENALSRFRLTYPRYRQELDNEDSNEITVDRLQLGYDVVGYKVEVIGGQWADWTIIEGPVLNTDYNPSPDFRYNRNNERIVVATLPPISEMTTGGYWLRVVFLMPPGVAGLPPLEQPFFIRTDRGLPLRDRSYDAAAPGLAASNLINISSPNVSGGSITLGGPTTFSGSIQFPPGAQYYKVEIKDIAVGGSFPDWTTINDTVPSDVSGGALFTLPVNAGIGPGSYQVRVVVVGADGNFAAERTFNLTVR